MRVETNEALVKRMKKLAQYLFFGSFGLLIVWFFISSQWSLSAEVADNPFLSIILPSLMLPAAFIFSMISVRFTNLWVRQPRPEEVIRQNMKGLSNRSVLYNYYHFPARHVLITPRGVYAMVTRFQDGRFSVTGNKWKSHKSAVSRFFSMFRFDGLGNPTDDAKFAAAHVQKKLEPIAPGIEVHPVIVFVDPRTAIEAEDTDVPVVFATGEEKYLLKDFLRDEWQAHDQIKKDVLTAEQIAAFEAATLR